MATPWIKLEHTTPEKPEMLRAAKMLKKDFRVVFYHWVKLWIWADSNVGDDGVAAGATLAALSNIARLDGIAEAFAEPVENPDGSKGANWLEETPYGVRFRDWTRHNGASAKSRALKQRRRSSAKHNDDVPKKGTRSLSLSLSDSSSLFEEFWKKYPLKIGKKPARKRWEQAIRTTDPRVIIDAAAEYAASAAGRDYPKHAEGWLNQERWNDDRAAWAIRYGGASSPHKPSLDEIKSATAQRMKERFGE